MSSTVVTPLSASIRSQCHLSSLPFTKGLSLAERASGTTTKAGNSQGPKPQPCFSEIIIVE